MKKMRGIHYYYLEFQHELDVFNAVVGQEFRAFSETHSPREVFLWLEKRRADGQLPPAIESLLTNFYWEIT
jgi:hypothetical protein